MKLAGRLLAGSNPGGSTDKPAAEVSYLLMYNRPSAHTKDNWKAVPPGGLGLFAFRLAAARARLALAARAAARAVSAGRAPPEA